MSSVIRGPSRLKQRGTLDVGDEMVAPVMGSSMVTLAPDMISVGSVPYTDPRAGGGNKSAVLSITDRISKTLEDFGSMFDQEEEDQLMRDVTDQVNGLEGGQLKYQLKTFINRYKDITSRVETVSHERTEILESLSEWFSGASLETSGIDMTSDDQDIDPLNIAARDKMIESKQGFQKLKLINEEIAERIALGQDVSHLERERTDLQMRVIEKFKAFKDAKKRAVVVEKPPKKVEAEIWKHAAGEIVGMLHKVRGENSEFITKLEQQITSFMKNLESQAEEINRLNVEIKETKLMEKQWHGDCMVVTADKAALAKKFKKIKKELKNTRKDLGKFQKLKRSAFDNDDDGDDDNPYSAPSGPRLAPGGSTAAGGARMSDDPTILKAQLRDCRTQLDKYKENLKELQEKMSTLEQDLESKDDDLIRLEQDKKELLHQMKQASVRPDKRRLSIGSSPDVLHVKSGIGFPGASISGVSIKHDSGHHDHRCVDCGGPINKPGTRPSTPSVPSLTTTKKDSKTSKPSNGKPGSAGKSPKTSAEEDKCKNCDELNSKIAYLDLELTNATERILDLEDQLEENQLEIAISDTNEETFEDEQCIDEELGDEDIIEEDALAPVQEKDENNSNIPYFEPISEPDKPNLLAAQAIVDRANSATAIQTKTVNALAVNMKTANQTDNQTVAKPSKQDHERKRRVSRIHSLRMKKMLQPPKQANVGVLYPGSDESGQQIMKEIVYIKLKSNNDVHYFSKGAQTDPSITGPDRKASHDDLMSSSNGGVPSINIVTEESAKIGVIPTRAKQQAARQERRTAENYDMNQSSLVQRELERMMDGVHCFVGSINKVIDNEMSTVTEATNLRAVLPVSDLYKLEENLKRPASCIKKGSKSQIAHNALSASMSKRCVTDAGHDNKPTENVVEDRIKIRVRQIGEDAINMLRRTYDMVFAALMDQQEQNKQLLSMAENAEDYMHQGPKLKESRSNLELSVPGELVLYGSKTTLLPARSRSAMSMRRGSSHQHATVIDDAQDKSISWNKEEMSVRMATIPKKGMIALTTHALESQKGVTTKELAVGDIEWEKSHRKLRPVPLTRKRLIQKQHDLVTRTSPRAVAPSMNTNGPSKTPTANINKLTSYELPESYFSDYTVKELEQKAAERSQNARKHNVLAMMQHVTLPKLIKQHGRKRQGSTSRTEGKDKTPMNPSFPPV